MLRGESKHFLLASRSRLTIDHASLSRLSTVSTPVTDTSSTTRGRSMSFFHVGSFIPSLARGHSQDWAPYEYFLQVSHILCMNYIAR